MAISQVFTAPNNSTLASFKAWAQPISLAFSTFGWQQSSDTGQVNWSTISTLPAANASVYEIWMMSDSLQATNPVFVKIEYGAAAAASIPQLAITVGNGSTGSGTLNNPAPRQLYNNTLNSSTTALECDFSGSTNRMHFILWRTSYPMYFSIERSHDTNGNDTAGYVTMLYGGGFLTVGQQTLMPAPTGALPYEQYGLTFQTSAVHGTNNSSAYGTSIAVVPFFPMVSVLDNPLTGALCCTPGDFLPGQVFTASMYGNTYNYICTSTSAAGWNRLQSGNSVAAMRFD